MSQEMSWLQKNAFRKIITVLLVAITFLVVPAFGYSQSLQAQAKPLTVETDSYTVDSDTVKRIQQKAEDLGDSPERPIGDTGLKNIKKLGENVPETIDFNARQKLGADPKEALDDVKNKAQRAVEGTKRAVKDVVD